MDPSLQAMHGAPLYIAETCPSQIRGTLISLKELFIVLGILVGFFVLTVGLFPNKCHYTLVDFFSFS